MWSNAKNADRSNSFVCTCHFYISIWRKWWKQRCFLFCVWVYFCVLGNSLNPFPSLYLPKKSANFHKRPHDTPKKSYVLLDLQDDSSVVTLTMGVFLKTTTCCTFFAVVRDYTRSVSWIMKIIYKIRPIIIPSTCKIHILNSLLKMF